MPKQKLGLNSVFVTPSAQADTAYEHAFPEQREHDAVQSVVGDIERTQDTLSVDRLVPNPFQPRKLFDEESLKSLADSIKEDGVLQRLVVRVSPSQPRMYEIAAGERRWRAAQMAGLSSVPCEILTHCPDTRMKRIALIENLLREQLTPVELALTYETLLQERDEQGGKVYTIRSLEDMLKVGVGHVDDHLSILRVPADVRKLIEDDPTIPLRIVRDLGKVENGADRAYLVEEVRSRSLKTAQLQAVLKQLKAAHTPRQEKATKRIGGAPALPQQREELLESTADHPRLKPSSPVLALAVLEQKLQKDHRQFVQIAERIRKEVVDLGPEEKEVVRQYVRQWLDLWQTVDDTL